MNPFSRKPTTRQLLQTINRKVDHLMTSVDEVTAAFTTLTTDLEALAATATAEFTKLETELSEGQAPNLTPLAEAISAVDAKVRSAVVPTV